MRRALCTALATLLALPVLPVLAIAPPGRTVTGIAVDPEGRPVAGATVWLDIFSDQDTPAAVTGADGRFTVSLPDDSESIEVCAPGSLVESVEVGQTSGELTAEIHPGARISGQVVDAAGEPVSGLSLHPVIAGSSVAVLVDLSSRCGGSDASVTDREGRFTLAPLQSGWYTVRDDEGLVESKPVHPAPGQALGGMRLVVERVAQVTGRVTAQDGSPLSGAKVSSDRLSTETDAAGRYRLTWLPPGPRRVRAGDGKHKTAERTIELAAGENRLDLVLTDPRVIHGRVLRPGGGPAGGATVATGSEQTTAAADGTFRLVLPDDDCSCGATAWFDLAGPGGVKVRSSVHKDSQFHFDRLAAGTYTLRAYTGNNLLLELPVQVPTPAGSELVVDLGSR